MDQFAIVAEIRRRGHTIESLARELEVSARALRKAFKSPSRKANALIARYLDIPVHELWPDWFDGDGDVIPPKYREKLSRRRRAMASHESVSG